MAIYNRDDDPVFQGQLSPFEVWLGSSAGERTTPCATHVSVPAAAGPFVLHCGGVIAEWVTLRLTGTRQRPLEIAELYVYHGLASPPMAPSPSFPLPHPPPQPRTPPVPPAKPGPPPSIPSPPLPPAPAPPRDGMLFVERIGALKSDLQDGAQAIDGNPETAAVAVAKDHGVAVGREAGVLQPVVATMDL